MTRLFAGTPFDVPPRCDRCGDLEEDCQCDPLPSDNTAGGDKTAGRIAPEKQAAKIRVDRRKHKRLVTIVWGLDAESNDLPNVLSQLKSACGCGGSVREEQIELQGDHLDRVKEQLKKIGYKVQRR